MNTKQMQPMIMMAVVMMMVILAMQSNSQHQQSSITSHYKRHHWTPHLDNRGKKMIDSRGRSKKAAGKCCANFNYNGDFNELREWSCDNFTDFDEDLRASCPTKNWSNAWLTCGVGQGMCA